MFDAGQIYPDGFGNLTGKAHQGWDVWSKASASTSYTAGSVYAPFAGWLERTYDGLGYWLRDGKGKVDKLYHLVNMPHADGTYVNQQAYLGKYTKIGNSSVGHMHWERWLNGQLQQNAGAYGVPYNVLARERGGPVSAGRPYIVGEKRPELFVPQSDGYIYPSVPGYRGRGGGGSQSGPSNEALPAATGEMVEVFGLMDRAFYNHIASMVNKAPDPHARARGRMAFHRSAR
ncbi:MAG: hypothetical protein M3P51_09125 [Chloroflexota bacterium]|nr:hypothetical protein [Chloroflexota bacterium]